MRRPAHTLARRLTLLTVLTFSLVMLAMPTLTHADIWGECDADLSARNQWCDNAYSSCIFLSTNSVAECNTQYYSCLGEANRFYQSCLAEKEEALKKWPVIDKRTRCLQGCEIYQVHDWEAYLACKSACLAANPL